VRCLSQLLAEEMGEGWAADPPPDGANAKTVGRAVSFGGRVTLAWVIEPDGVKYCTLIDVFPDASATAVDALKALRCELEGLVESLKAAEGGEESEA
jgi:hypothetical protein